MSGASQNDRRSAWKPHGVNERLFAALKGFGATVRLVMLPNEAHGYAARETLLHVLAERLNWFDKYVKNAATRSTTDASR